MSKPVNWVPDEEGNGCSICHSEFSLTRRRHHCRECGALVCGYCSDHFVVLPGEASEVRICDNCEIKMKEAAVASERMDVNVQITESLKSALKEKANEIELFKNFLLHVIEGEDLKIIDSEKFGKVRVSVSDLCSELESVSSIYSDLKMASLDLERDIRAVAKRCLQAEQASRDGLVTAREIEEYSKQIGLQAKLIDQLRQRIDRLSGPQQAGSPVLRPVTRPPPMSPMSPRIQVVELQRPVSGAASVCEVARKLVGL